MQPPRPIVLGERRRQPFPTTRLPSVIALGSPPPMTKQTRSRTTRSCQPERETRHPGDGEHILDRYGAEAAEHSWKELTFPLGSGTPFANAFLWAAHFARGNVDMLLKLGTARRTVLRNDSNPDIKLASQTISITFARGSWLVDDFVHKAMGLAAQKGDMVLVCDLQHFKAELHEYTDPMAALFEILVGYTPEKSGGMDNK